jgi:hypothetical protein
MHDMKEIIEMIENNDQVRLILEKNSSNGLFISSSDHDVFFYIQTDESLPLQQRLRFIYCIQEILDQHKYQYYDDFNLAKSSVFISKDNHINLRVLKKIINDLEYISKVEKLFLSGFHIYSHNDRLYWSYDAFLTMTEEGLLNAGVKTHTILDNILSKYGINNDRPEKDLLKY